MMHTVAVSMEAPEAPTAEQLQNMDHIAAETLISLFSKRARACITFCRKQIPAHLNDFQRINVDYLGMPTLVSEPGKWGVAMHGKCPEESVGDLQTLFHNMLASGWAASTMETFR